MYSCVNSYQNGNAGKHPFGEMALLVIDQQIFVLVGGRHCTWLPDFPRMMYFWSIFHPIGTDCPWSIACLTFLKGHRTTEGPFVQQVVVKCHHGQSGPMSGGLSIQELSRCSYLSAVTFGSSDFSAPCRCKEQLMCHAAMYVCLSVCPYICGSPP